MYYKIKNKWLSASIKKKIIIIVSTFIISLSFMNFHTAYQAEKQKIIFSTLMDDYYSINNLLISFRKGNVLFNEVIKSDGEESLQQYLDNLNKTGQNIEALSLDLDKVSKERYLITRAIKNSFQVYKGSSMGILLSLKNVKAYDEYYNVLTMSSYIEDYINELLQQSLVEGYGLYDAIVLRMRLTRIIVTAFIIIILIFTGIMSVFLINSIVTPIIKLSRATEELENEHLDIEDISIPNQDEIGNLAVAFNKMKSSIKLLIATEKEKNDVIVQLHKEEIENMHTQKLLDEAKFLLLQSQINPHFLFNTLNLIARNARIEEAKKTEELIINLSKLFRYNLETDKKIVSLSRELEMISQYMAIQVSRFRDRIKFVTQISPDIDSDTIYLPSFILQPILENSVIHGIEPKEEGGIIRLKILKQDTKMIITITDNGIGMDQEMISALVDERVTRKGHLSGIGFKNVEQRLNALYPESSMRIYSRMGEGTSISITFNLDNKEYENSIL